MRLKFWSICLLALVLEIPFADLIFADIYPAAYHLDLASSMGVGPVFLFHLLSVIVLFFFLEPKGTDWFSANRKWTRTGAFFQFFFPVVGLFLFLFLFIMMQYVDEPLHKYDIAGEPDDEALPGTKDGNLGVALRNPGESKKERLLRELDIMPLADILNGSDNELKRDAMDKLARIMSPQSIKVIASHRSDPTPETRFYATSALIRIKKEYDQRLDSLKAQLKAKPSAHNRMNLAQLYLDMVEADILDGGSSRDYKKEALYHLREIIFSEESVKEAYWTFLEKVDSDDRKNIKEVVEKLKSEKHFDDVFVKKAMAFGYYRLGQFQSMNEILKLLAIEKNADKNWYAVASWWQTL